MTVRSGATRGCFVFILLAGTFLVLLLPMSAAAQLPVERGIAGDD